jgi:hypothetical protein
MATLTYSNVVINQAITVPFTSVNLVTGKTSFTNVYFMLNGVVVAMSYTTAEIGNGLYTFTFTPVSTGTYSVFIEQTIAASLNVVSRTVLSYLQNIEDEALGSWSWDKTTGILTLVTQSGTQLATFAVTDNLTLASRSRSS